MFIDERKQQGRNRTAFRYRGGGSDDWFTIHLSNKEGWSAEEAWSSEFRTSQGSVFILSGAFMDASAELLETNERENARDSLEQHCSVRRSSHGKKNNRTRRRSCSTRSEADKDVSKIILITIVSSVRSCCESW